MSDDEKLVRELCLVVAADELRRRQWSLLNAQELANRIFYDPATHRADLARQIAGGNLEAVKKQLAWAGVGIYSEVLYYRCDPDHSADYQTGWEELSRCLRLLAIRHLKRWDLYRGEQDTSNLEDLVNEASLLILKGLKKSEPQSPRTFLTYCEWEIKYAAKRLFGKDDRIVDLPLAPDEYDDAEPGIPPETVSEELTVESAEAQQAEQEQEQNLKTLHREIVLETARMFVLHPRAAKQLLAAVLINAFNCSGEEVARVLDIESPGAAVTAASRGRAQFRENPRLVALNRQWFEAYSGSG